MEPTIPETHTHKSPSNGADFDIEDQPKYPQKRILKTNKSYRDEWRYGSKVRVVKYYAVHVCIGIVVGGIIGVIVGLCLRYAGK
ncbi:uncharacterized protein N7487_005473 [Penicillium crustosum]|uniref:uncharacterized protein n=1 Tax=Penicillium crustosum TaxID=36656 RepID=UPI002395B473|nr:uncharacterized protein N7487_005473 [Penicillium crustosum]KAJ5411114.1 hypothetical protein N7487_005473 [Penicillium crustosum]